MNTDLVRTNRLQDEKREGALLSVMGALTGFLPFITFALAEKVAGTVPALACGALVSLALLVRDRIRGEDEIHLLEAGSALIFGGLFAWSLLGGVQTWSVWFVRLWVDAGLVVVVGLSVALGRPFTLEYSRKDVPSEVMRSRPLQIGSNNIVASVWALAFAVLALADGMMVMWPATPAWAGVGLTLGALAVAAWFTGWFPKRAVWTDSTS
jgi:hypothetical protein